TFLGKAGMYLEDLFVLPDYRGLGVGRAMLRELAAIAVKRGYGRLEWQCLDWNEPSIKFYKSLGAAAMGDRTTYRLSGSVLNKLAGTET
ncbi:MAG: GNAT family N-acetyltransferase, partial [Oscillospiraceae bacterium]|nr:GNAT family N-acetyltransferase [Oscillospiraceae bacterium]